MFKSTGTIIYDPYRGKMKNRINWWCICTVDKEITRYYRYYLQKKFGITIFQPAWDAHISIIRGEEPSENNKYLWKKYNNMRVEFEYSHNVSVQKGGKYFTIDATCDIFTVIRNELGLHSKYPQHLTVGKIYNV